MNWLTRWSQTHCATVIFLVWFKRGHLSHVIQLSLSVHAGFLPLDFHLWNIGQQCHRKPKYEALFPLLCAYDDTFERSAVWIYLLFPQVVICKKKDKNQQMTWKCVSVWTKPESGVISIIIIYWNMRKNSTSLIARLSPGPGSDGSIQNVSRSGKRHRQAGGRWHFDVPCIHVLTAYKST